MVHIFLLISMLRGQLTDCQVHLAIQITNIYETSHPEFQYDVCTILDDDHGYSAGIIQFTTYDCLIVVGQDRLKQSSANTRKPIIQTNSQQ